MIKWSSFVGPSGKMAVTIISLLAAGCQNVNTQISEGTAQLVWPAPPSEPRFHFEQVIRGSGDVVELTASEKLKMFATGEGANGASIAKPFGLFARNGILYIGDSVARRVHVFDLNKKTYLAVGAEGIGSLAKPLGLALDNQNRLYVCDATTKRVLIYDDKGKYLSTIEGKELLDRPTGLAVSKNGDKVFVVDTGGVDSLRHHVVVFDHQGKHLYDIGKRGKEDGEFNLPLTATIGPDGTLYVVDGGNFRVQAFSQEGQFKFAIGTIGNRSGQFARPKSVAIDADNNIYVSDAAFGNLQIFNHQGQLLMWIGARSSRNEPGKYMLPSGIAVDRTDGRVFLADQFFRKIEVYRPEHTPLRSVGN